MIPILLITRDNTSQLRACVESIENNTTNSYELHIIDNASHRQEHINYLNEINSKKNVTVWWNNKNKWILSVNKCLASIEKNCPDYYVISDSDIIFPDTKPCWLTELVRCMEQYPFLGKLGLSLSLENLHDKPNLSHILSTEKKYYNELLTPEIYLALVDTTAAIYRPDVYVWNKYRIYPRHLWAMKPGYYSGRHKDLISYHMGWDEKEYAEEDKIISKQIDSKVKCFAKYAGRIDPATLRHASITTKLYYYCVSPMGRLFWAGHL